MQQYLSQESKTFTGKSLADFVFYPFGKSTVMWPWITKQLGGQESSWGIFLSQLILGFP